MEIVIGVLADVHEHTANLASALAHLAKHDCDLIVCAGDIVALTPADSTDAVLSRTLDILTHHCVAYVSGNHDRAARKLTERAYPRSSSRLRAMQDTWCREIGGVLVWMQHEAPSGYDLLRRAEWGKSGAIAKAEIEFLEGRKIDVLVAGHTHTAYRRTFPHGTRVIFNPGAVAATGHGGTGTFGILRVPSKSTELYDVASGRALKLRSVER